MFENKLYLIALHYIYSFDGKSWILIDKTKPSLPLNQLVCGVNKVYGSTYVNKVMEHLLTGPMDWIQTGDIATPGLEEDARITSITSDLNGLFVTGKDSVKSGVFHLSFVDGKWVAVGDFFKDKNLITTSVGNEGEAYVGTTLGREGSQVFKFDKDGKWIQLGDILPIQLTEVHYSLSENIIFAGGWDPSNHYESVSIHKFDAVNNKWIPLGRNIRAGKYDQLGEIRVIDGKIFTWIRSETGRKGGVYRFDEINNSWVEILPYPWRILLGMFRIEKDLYVFAREERGYGVFKLVGLDWERVGSNIVPQDLNLAGLEWFEMNPV